MKLIVDGEIYQRQVKGGISRLWNEVLPRLVALDPALVVKILTDGKLKQQPPVAARISHHAMSPYHLYLRPGRLWRPLVNELKLATRRLQTGPINDAIWQATYYTPPRRWRGPFVVFFYDLIEERFPDLFASPRHDWRRQRKRFCTQTADLILCISQTTQADVCSYYGAPAAKTRVIPLAAHPLFHQLDFQTPPDGSTRPPFLLFLGDRSAYKNFERLVQAYSQWSRRHEVELLVGGHGWTQEETALLQRWQGADRVHLQKHVDDETLCHLYNRAAAFVYPSLYEGFGIPLLEAMACGCPIVASDIPTTREVAGDVPYYFPPTDVESLRDALEQALVEGRPATRVEAGLQRAAAYSWDATTRQLWHAYHEIG